MGGLAPLLERCADLARFHAADCRASAHPAQPGFQTILTTATQTPIGPGTLRDLLNIRVFDAWVHEQDIRRAVEHPGHLTGPVAEHAVDRVAMAIPYVVGRKVKPADGTTAVFTMPRATGPSIAVRMEGGRANALHDIPAAAHSAALHMDAETFTCLGCGRWEPAAALHAGRSAARWRHGSGAGHLRADEYHDLRGTLAQMVASAWHTTPIDARSKVYYKAHNGRTVHHPGA